MHGFELQDIKKDKISAGQLDDMKKLASSFDALFSKRAILYKTMKLKEKVISEKEIRNLILQEYTFLKRPVIIYEEQIFIGNSPKEINKLLDIIS